MQIKLFYDDNLAHASYAIEHKGETVLIDPARDPQPYYNFAKENNSKIVAVIETHPHADFVSSHLEVSKTTGAKIYCSKLLQPDYTSVSFDGGDTITLSDITLHAINTPGHSPDSISILLKDENGNPHTLFTGDTLFIGDVGRPDLRENVGALTAKREELAKAMYHSLRDRIMTLPDDVVVYPAHGAGSLCGKNLSKDTSSTIGREKAENYALQTMSESDFVKVLLEDQPFVPKYFGHDVDTNKKGAPSFSENVNAVKSISENEIPKGSLIIDTRKQDLFNAGHLPGSINLLVGGKFETWLGSIVSPGEKFYLIAESKEIADTLVKRIAKIGYESMIAGVLAAQHIGSEVADGLDLADFDAHPEKYTIVDIRNNGEVKSGKIFDDALTIPLPELRERVGEIPSGKPVMIHCAGGYRSAAGMSIVKNAMPASKVIDLSENILEYNKRKALA